MDRGGVAGLDAGIEGGNDSTSASSRFQSHQNLTEVVFWYGRITKNNNLVALVKM